MKKVLLCVISIMLVLAVIVTVSAAAPEVALRTAKKQIAIGESVTVVMSVSGVEAASAHVSIAVPEGLEIVSGKWLKNGTIKDFRGSAGVITFGSAIAVEGDLIELVFKGVKDLNEVSKLEATVQFKNGAELVLKKTVSAEVRVICTSHTYGPWETTVAATCDAAGVESQICRYCTAKIDRTVDALGHNIVEVPAVAPTCTESGLTAGTACTRCQLVGIAQTVVPALGHETVELSAVAPTCTATGLTAGAACARCESAIVEQMEVAALGHEIAAIPSVAPTCTATGRTEGSVCTRCQIVLVEQEVLPAAGHRYNDGVCTVCGAEETDTVPGDVNGDGQVNSLDGLLLMRYLNGWSNVEVSDAMDVSGDGQINSLDGLLLMRYLNGWDISLG